MISIKRESRKELTIYLLLFLIGFNFGGKAVFGIYLLALYVFMFLNSALVVPKLFFTVIILCVGVLASQIFNGVDMTLFSLLKLGVYPVVFWTFYKIADYKVRASKNGNNCLVVFFYMMFFFALGNMAHMIADISITDLSKINMGRRILNDVWSGGTTPTTIIVGWGCINMATLLYAFEEKRTKKLTLIFSSIMITVYMIFSFIVATRLGIVNFVLTFVVFIFLLSRDKNINISLNTLIKILGAILVVVILGIKLLPYVMSSNLYLRLSGDSLKLLDSNGRIEATVYLLQHFSEALLGGEYFTEQYGLQQHNILFQMYDLYGLLPFVCLGLILIRSVRYTIQVAKNDSFKNSEKRFVILFFFSLMLYYFEEPVISSNYIITSMLFGYLGYMSAMRWFADKEEVRNG